MLSDRGILADPRAWVSAIALAVSSASALISWRSTKIASRALAIAKSQEERRQPKLGIYMFRGYRRRLPKRQLFGFLVSVTNPTDIDNSIARAELQVAYLLEKDVQAVCRIPHNPTVGEAGKDDLTQEHTIFSLPVRIDAHQTISGWFFFALDDHVIGRATIDSHVLILEDTHGFSTPADPITVTEWTDESKKD